MRARSELIALWLGYALSGLVITFLLFDGLIKVLHLPVVTDAMTQLGYPASVSRGLGVLILLCTAAYALPRTAVLGAVLLTGVMGGAIATHLRVGSPLFSHLLFGVYLAVALWAGLYLRSPQIRALAPWHR